MRELLVSRAARRDLAEIAAYIQEAAGSGIAREVVVRLRARLRLIAETPGEIGTHRPEIAEGIRSFPVPPYVLFFRYRGDAVMIARVLHERRDVDTALEDNP